MNILIVGGTGFIGQALLAEIQEHHVCTVWCRNLTKVPAGCQAVTTLSALPESASWDAVINLAGSPIDRRWTASVKADVLNSRVEITQQLMQYLSTRSHPPQVMIQASAIGYYGSQQAEPVTESTSPHSGFTHEVCKAWEQVACDHCADATRLVRMRLGVVLGAERALMRMSLPIQYYLGTCLGSGKQLVSWVHVHDVIRVITRALEDPQMEGVYNVTAPEPVSHQALNQIIAKQLNRPLWFKLPEWGVRLLFGEMGEVLLLDSQSVRPQRLLDLGFSFEYPTADQAVRSILPHL